MTLRSIAVGVFLSIAGLAFSSTASAAAGAEATVAWSDTVVTLRAPAPTPPSTPCTEATVGKRLTSQGHLWECDGDPDAGIYTWYMVP